MGFTILAPIARLCRSFPTFRRPFPLSRLPVAFPVAFRNEVETERDTSRPYISKVKFYIVSENYMADYMAINVQMISVFVLFFS